MAGSTGDHYELKIANELLREVSKLNSSISNIDKRKRYVSSANQFLFGYVPGGRISKEEYRRYVAFRLAVTDTLKEFGLCISSCGYTYISDAIMIIIDMNTFDICLNTDVYPYIAEKYGLNNIGAIEHNIRNAIKAAYIKNQQIPGTNRMFIFEKKPSNKKFLFRIAEIVFDRMSEKLSVSLG